MNDPNHPSAKQIFFEALEKETPDQRATYLDQACRGNLELRKRVENLLAKHFQQDNFMKQPVVEDSSAATPAAPMPEGPGMTIGRYNLREKIGEGGCGIV